MTALHIINRPSTREVADELLKVLKVRLPGESWTLFAYSPKDGSFDAAGEWTPGKPWSTQTFSPRQRGDAEKWILGYVGLGFVVVAVLPDPDDGGES
jgi:IS4 transposase